MLQKLNFSQVENLVEKLKNACSNGQILDNNKNL